MNTKNSPIVMRVPDRLEPVVSVNTEEVSARQKVLWRETILILGSSVGCLRPLGKKDFSKRNTIRYPNQNKRGRLGGKIFMVKTNLRKSTNRFPE